LEKGYPFHLNKLESLLPKDDLCQVWLKLAQQFWRTRFLNDPTPFSYLALYFNKLELHLPKDNSYNVCLNLVSWSWRRFFEIFSAFLLFRYNLPLEKGYPLHLNELESPLPKNGLCQVWSNLVQWFWRRFLIDYPQFSHFCDYIPLEEDMALYFNKLEFHLLRDTLQEV
jgi:hypothetical protein